MKWTAEKLAAEVGAVCSLPTIYFRLNELVNDVHVSNKDVGALISEDAGLSVRLLRMVNSAFFGLPSSVDTITRAVTVIGTRQLNDLVLMTSVVDMFDGIPNEVANMELFWQHSIATGVSARVLANYHREPNVERFFVAGLLHDIGRLVIFQKLPEETTEILTLINEIEIPLYVAEKQVLGFDHTDVGRAMLDQWGLPEHLVTAVGGHHHPSALEEIDVDSAIVHVADVIANVLGMGWATEVYVPELDEAAWKRLDLPPSILSPAVGQIKRQYDDAIELIFSDKALNSSAA